MSGEITPIESVVEWSTDAGATWTEMPNITTVTPDGGDRDVGETFVHDQDTPLLGVGKRKAVTLTITGVYNAVSEAPYDKFEDFKRYRTPVRFRWTLTTDTTGNEQFTSADGYVMSVLPPEADAAASEIALFEAKVKVPDYTRAIIA